jgi:hypothetical protein
VVYSPFEHVLRVGIAPPGDARGSAPGARLPLSRTHARLQRCCGNTVDIRGRRPSARANAWILKLLDPQSIVTIGDMPSFTNLMAPPYYFRRKWIHMDRASDLRGIDIQSYAAAVYLTPDAPPQSGTSFWRDRVHGCRRRPNHPLERKRLGSDEAVAAARSVVYDHYNIEHGENWERLLVLTPGFLGW